MKHYELSSQPRTPSVPAARTVPWVRRWPLAALALVALGAVVAAFLFFRKTAGEEIQPETA